MAAIQKLLRNVTSLHHDADFKGDILRRLILSPPPPPPPPTLVLEKKSPVWIGLMGLLYQLVT